MTAIAADHIKWDEAVSLIHALEREGRYRMCLIVTFGCFWGLRIGEILSLTWEDILGRDNFLIQIEKSGRRKNPKTRRIEIIPDVRALIERLYPKLNVKNTKNLIFLNTKTGKAYLTQNINKRLKIIGRRYQLSTKNLSSHSLRKTFGRKYASDNQFSEESIVLLSEIFQHQKISDTRRYLGITEDEVKSVYKSFRL
jgi:integrase